jgi:hypothetical protein
MKALKKGFLKGCPNISKILVTTLNPSSATAKGRMNCPKKGICSTTPKPKQAKETADRPLSAIALPQPNSLLLPLFDNVPAYPGPVYQATTGPNIIMDDESIANVFCFSAFTNKTTGVMYNDLTGNFPFMSLDENICFFVLYHYKTNAILATPIANLDNKSIFEAYKAHFEMLEAKGNTPKVNGMDNQAKKYIKLFLTKKNANYNWWSCTAIE